MVDNAVLAAGLHEFAPAAGGARTIITSTERAFTAQGLPVDVGEYRCEESLGYLRDRTGRDDDMGAALVAEEVGDSPLGLAQASAVLVVPGRFLRRVRATTAGSSAGADAAT